MSLLLKRHVVVLLLAACCAAVGCARDGGGSTAQAVQGTGTSAAGWPDTRDALIEEYFKAHPAFAVVAGRHEYDGMLPDWSATAIAAEVARLKAARERVRAFGDSALSEADRLERDYFIARMDRDLFWMETVRAPFRNPSFYLDIDSLDPSPYLTRNYAPLDARMRAYTKYAQAIPRAAEQIRTNLRPPLSRPLVERGVSAFRGFAEFYAKDVTPIFASVKDPALQQAFTAANSAAATAMRRLADSLEAERASATAEFALGADTFAQMLEATERVTIPLAELEAMGRKDLQRNQAALKEACSSLAPGKSIHDCVSQVGGNKPEGGSVQAARAQMGDLKKFVQETNIVTIPSDDEARVEEAPPYNRANFAYIDVPGPYEKGQPAVYYIAPPDPSWSPKEQHDYLPGKADLLFTSVHEVWPGHFLQFLHSNRTKSPVARLFVGYAFAEGWAHYTEEMMVEVGLGKGDPETHIGQLMNALLRNVRYLSAIGLHTKGMTVAESERMFLEEAYADAGNARQQAARGTYDPAYLNYTMGKLLIRQLRDDWTASRGGRAAWRAFHDQFLSYGGPPIPMVREAMMRQR